MLSNSCWSIMKVFLTVFVLALVSSCYANRMLCPHPDEAGEEVVSERIKLDRLQAGHATLELDLSEKVLGRHVSCFTLVTESQNTGPHIISIGQNIRKGYSVKVYGEDKTDLLVFLEAYDAAHKPPPPPPSS